jgi:hypothetical protein
VHLENEYPFPLQREEFGQQAEEKNRLWVILEAMIQLSFR